jgi:hypothetical protein
VIINARFSLKRLAHMPVICMNQFEGETLRFAGALFAVMCIVFPFLRRQLWLWSSLPRCVMLASLGWLASALVVVGAPRMALLQGLLFALSYFVIVLASAPLLAAGMFEVVLGLYASFNTGDDTIRVPARPHFLACVSCLGCLAAYCGVVWLRLRL